MITVKVTAGEQDGKKGSVVEVHEEGSREILIEEKIALFSSILGKCHPLRNWVFC